VIIVEPKIERNMKPQKRRKKMKYYYIDKEGKVNDIPEIEVTKCILIGNIVGKKKKVKILMDKKRFDEWRSKEDGD
jgi:hypothetical protein